MSEQDGQGENAEAMPIETHSAPAAGNHTTRASQRPTRYEQGIWAALLALVPAFLLAALAGVPSPLEPIAELLIRYTPVSLANALLNVFGGYARTLALLGAAALAMPVGGLLALLAPARDPRCERVEMYPPHVLRLPSRELLRWVLTVTAALLTVLPLALLAAYPTEAVSALLAGIAYAPALWLLRSSGTRHIELRRTIFHHVIPSQSGGAAPSQHMRSMPRRAFLGGLLTNGTRAALLLAFGSFDRWSDALGSVLARGETLRTLFRFNPPAPRVTGFPVAGEEPEVTPVERFYVISKNDVDPRIAPAAWSLRIEGIGNSPLTLTYDQLLALPRTDQYVTLRCVSNPVDGHLMSTACWSGVPLASLLQRAGIPHGTVAVQLYAPDAYSEVIPLQAALAPTALLAYGMNGQTLARRHGGPVRALLPGLYGFKNVKWLERITLLPTVARGFWEATGWTAAGIHSVARIDVWRRIPTVLAVQSAAGAMILVAGVAFAGTHGVSAVQVRVDGGAWHDATLHTPALSPLTWVQWRVDLPLTPGKHTLIARLIDGAGRPQDATHAAIYPDGAQGLHSLQIFV